MAAMTYGDVLARNIRAARSRLGINQESVAARMRSLGYAAWLQQTAANVEKNRRRVTAEEIHGLARALETSIASLMRPADDDKTVAFPSGAAIPAASVAESAGRGANDGAVAWAGDSPVFPS
jgi:transcriptional regulator with XRE-family HTH domain